MSNLIINGNFAYPDLLSYGITNDWIECQAMTNDMVTQFGWKFPLLVPYISLQQGITAYNYPDSTAYPFPNTLQYISIQYTSYLQQYVNISTTGFYKLSFQYTSRPGYSMNQLQIYFNGSLIDTLTTTVTVWTQYSTIFNVNTTGSLILKFQGQDISNDKDIALTNISLVTNSTNAPSNITANNSFKNTIINGVCQVVDYNIIPGLTTSGTIITNFLQCYNNLSMKCDGIQSIFYRDSNSNVIGRMFGTVNNLYTDYYSQYIFRSVTKNDAVLNNTIMMTTSGLIINAPANPTTSNYNLDVYGTSNFRGLLSTSVDASIGGTMILNYANTLSTKINTINSAALFDTTSGVIIIKKLTVGNILPSSYTFDVNGTCRISNGIYVTNPSSFQTINGSSLNITTNSVLNSIDCTTTMSMQGLVTMGSAITITALNTTLTFPMPETIFCNCTSNAINIKLPDASNISTATSIRIYIRRILNTTNQINILTQGSQKIYDIHNNSSTTSANAIGNGCIIQLYIQSWYCSSGFV